MLKHMGSPMTKSRISQSQLVGCWTESGITAPPMNGMI